MRRYIMIILTILFLLALVFFIQGSYVPIKKTPYKHSSTDFIEPSERFLKCYEDMDCIKVKGSACPPNSGGTEVCVDKDYFQEYLSEIEKQAGREEEIACPEIYLVTNKTCSCIEDKCVLI